MERLRSHRDVVAVLKGRRRVTSTDIVAHYRVRDDVLCNQTVTSPEKRLGLAVSKAVGNAVIRNTVKRRFRVLAAKYEDHLPGGCDVVLRAKPGADRVPFASLEKQIVTLFDAIARKTQ